MPKADTALSVSPLPTAPCPSRVLSTLRFAGLFGWAMFLLLLSPRRALTQKRFPTWIIRRWHRGSLRVCGIDLAQHGEALRGKPVLYVANHVSYFDISVLGSVLDASFVAKSEVNGWPIFGYFARLQRTVFVKRKGRDVANQKQALADRLSSGDRLILFPEGTSSDGSRALRFKSALFDSASIEIDGEQVMVQPLSIAYSRFNGLPMGRNLRPHFAWYGDMELAPHLWRALGLGRIGVDLVFHPPVRLRDFGSRKALARHCEAVVDKGISSYLGGRTGDAPAGAAA